MAESGLRPAESLLNNRSRRHVLRLMSLPKGNYLAEDGPTELEASITIADAQWAEQEARKADAQPGVVLWTDGSRYENGGVGYAVVWKKGRRWAGRKVHMGYYQEAYDAECALWQWQRDEPSDTSLAGFVFSPMRRPRSRG